MATLAVEINAAGTPTPYDTIFVVTMPVGKGEVATVVVASLPGEGGFESLLNGAKVLFWTEPQSVFPRGGTEEGIQDAIVRQICQRGLAALPKPEDRGVWSGPNPTEVVRRGLVIPGWYGR